MEIRTDNKAVITFQYKFTFNDGKKLDLSVHLDKKNLNLIVDSLEDLPDWTKLSNHKCDHCPLDEKESPYCPAAVSIIDLIDSFGDSTSYEECDVEIIAEERTYTKKASLQKSISSILGLRMACSGCPILAKLKPMARFHLPFASTRETAFRTMAMYLLGQYFLFKKNKEPDWALENLKLIYEDIQQVNQNFSERLRSIQIRDANLNALTILDTFTHFVLTKIDDDTMKDLETLFRVYWT